MWILFTYFRLLLPLNIQASKIFSYGKLTFKRIKKFIVINECMLFTSNNYFEIIHYQGYFVYLTWQRIFFLHFEAKFIYAPCKLGQYDDEYVTNFSATLRGKIVRERGKERESVLEMLNSKPASPSVNFSLNNKTVTVRDTDSEYEYNIHPKKNCRSFRTTF